MKITLAILKRRHGMTVDKANALFGGQFSGWLDGDEIPTKYHSRLRQIFGLPKEAETATKSKPITKPGKKTAPVKSKRR